MIDFLCNIVAKIVFSGVNGIILIVPLIIVLRVLYGQVVETITLFKEM